MALSPLNTVQSLIDDVRVLLLDTVAPYRYADNELMVALNTCLQEGRRVRADLFVGRSGVVPFYAQPSGETFCVEAQFRLPFVFGTVAHALMRDNEDVQDARAASFMNLFYHMLGAPIPKPIQGGTPEAAKQKA